MFIASVFLIAKNYNQPKHSSKVKEISGVIVIQVEGNGNKQTIVYAITWINLINIMLIKRTQKSNFYMI